MPRAKKFSFPEPSSNWTPAERLQMIKMRAAELEEILRADSRGHLINRASVEAYLQHIRMLSTASSEMLEINRANLLGKPCNC
jgi:hypothetical protein